MRRDELSVANRYLAIVVAAQDVRRFSECRQHKPIPRRKSLVVAAGPYALLARIEKFSLARFDYSINLLDALAFLFGERFKQNGSVENRLAVLEVTFVGDIKTFAEHFAVFLTESAQHFTLRPYVKLAFHAFAVGVFG